jgi:hypothetical protein
MAGNPIYHEDVLQVSKLNEQLNVLIDKYQELIKLDKDLASNLAKKNTLSAEETKEVIRLNKEYKEATKASQDTLKAKKELEAIGQQRIKEMQKESTELEKQTRLQKQHDDALKNQGKTYAELSAKMKALMEDYKKTEVGTAAFEKLSKQIVQTNDKLKQYDYSLGNHQRNVGNYPKNSGAMNTALTQIANSFKKNITVTNEYNQEITQTQTINQRFTNLSQGIKGAWIGIAAGICAVVAASAGLIKFGKDVIASTESTADAWKEMTTGMQFGWDMLLRSFATGDFSNFTDRMNEAIKAGQEYARTLDDLEKRVRSVSIRESELNNAIDKERLALKNVNLTTTERQVHIDKLVSLEKGLADEKLVNADKLFKTELGNVSRLTGLSEGIIKNYVKQYSAFSPLIQQAEDYNTAVKNYEYYSKRALETGDEFNKQKRDELKIIIDNTNEQAKGFAHITESMGKAAKEGPGSLKALEDSWVAVNNVTHEYNLSVEKSLTKGELLDKKQDAAAAKAQKAADLAAKKAAMDTAFWAAANKNAEDQAKLYDDWIKGQEKADDELYKIKLQAGKATQDEIFAYEMKKQMDAVKFSEMSAQQQADAIKSIYKNALQSSTKGAAPAEEFTPTNAPTGPMNQPDVDLSGNKDYGYMAKMEKLNEYVQFVSEAYGKITDIIKQSDQEEMNSVTQKYNAEEKALDDQYKHKQISEAVYNQKKDALQKRRAEEELKLEKESKKKAQIMAIIQAIINTALGVTAALAKDNIAGAIINAALGALEVVAIASQKFEKGGFVGIEGKMLQGKRHNQGGVSLGALGTAEAGEWAGIINRPATQKYGDLLPEVFNSINSMRFEKAFAPINVVNVDSKWQRKTYEEMRKPKQEAYSFQKDGKTYIVKGNQTTILN